MVFRRVVRLSRRDFRLQLGRSRRVQLHRARVASGMAGGTAGREAAICEGGNAGASAAGGDTTAAGLLGRNLSAAPATRHTLRILFRNSWSGPFWLGLTTLASKLAGNRVSCNFRSYALSRTGRN